MQPGGRRGRRARRSGIDGLVALRRRSTVADVGRQRHLAGCLHARPYGSRANRTARVPRSQPLPHLDGVAAAQGQRVADGNAPRRTDEGLPAAAAVFHGSQHQDFGGAASAARGGQPRADDARVIGDQQVATRATLAELPRSSSASASADPVWSRRDRGSSRRAASRGSAGTWAMADGRQAVVEVVDAQPRAVRTVRHG